MGNEWGRSLDLKDAASSAQIWGDLWLLLAVQGLSVPIILCYFLFGSLLSVDSLSVSIILCFLLFGFLRSVDVFAHF